MSKKIVGGIYYIKVWQEDTRKEQYKIYIYLCDIDGKPVFVKLNSKSYSFIVQISIEKKNYPNNDVIQNDISYLDCQRLIKGIPISDFETKSERCYKGDLCFLDLVNLNNTIQTVKTISANDMRLIEEALDARISDYL